MVLIRIILYLNYYFIIFKLILLRLDVVSEMRLTLFVSIIVCLVVLPCVVLQYVEPPLHPLPPGFALRALVGFLLSTAIAQKSANRISADGAMAATITGTILTAASPVFIVGTRRKILVNLRNFN